MVVIFADQDLLRFPLESLSLFKSPQIQCIARDLSLQMHYHRLCSSESTGKHYHTELTFCRKFEHQTLPPSSHNQLRRAKRLPTLAKGLLSDFCIAAEPVNDIKKSGGKKAGGRGDLPSSDKSQDKKGEKKVCPLFSISKPFNLSKSAHFFFSQVPKEQGTTKESIHVDISNFRCILLNLDSCVQLLMNYFFSPYSFITFLFSLIQTKTFSILTTIVRKLKAKVPKKF